MSNDKTSTIVALGVFTLIVALIFGTLITAANTDAQTGMELAQGEHEDINGAFNVENDKVGPTNVTLTVRDNATRISETNELQVGDTRDYTIAGETISVTLEEIDANDIARFTIQYSRTYGWSDAAKSFASELDVLLAIVSFLLIMGTLGKVVFS